MRAFQIVIVALLIASCDSSRVYEDYNNLEEAFWHMDSVQRFTFTVEELEENHNVLATFRNSSSYPYYNIYFQYTLKDSSEKVLKEELKEYHFFDPKTGEPYGSGLGDLFDHSVLLEENYLFEYAGSYSLELKQYMRLDTLPFILSVGTRVEHSSVED